MTTYVDKEDRGHDPSEVVWEDFEGRLEHTLVVDDMIEKLVSLLYREFL